MLRMTPISAGMAGVEYLLRAAGCAEHDHAGDSREASSDGAEYLLAGNKHGEPEGQWAGAGLAMLGVSAGGTVSAEQMRAVYGRLEHPDTGVALGSRPRGYADKDTRIAAALAAEPTASEERQAQIRREVEGSQRQSRGYYDLTFSPVKSVSVYRAALEAAGEHDKAGAVEAAHAQAVRESLEYVESEVTTTRVGRHATIKETGQTVGEYARIDGLVATLWQHSSSREGDPHIHTHAAVLNRTMTEDGKIRAVDGQQFKAVKGRADMLYERRVEQLVSEATGARFGLRPDGKTREILGVDRELCEASSGRSAAIQAKIDERVAAYRERHGGEPGQQVMREIREQAWRTTRPPKTPLSPEALAERYERKHGETVLSEQVAGVARAAAGVERSGHPDGPARGREDELIVQAVQRTQGLHASWDETLLALELNKVLGEVDWQAGDAAGEIERLMGRALDPDGPAGVVPLAAPNRARVPAALREGGREDGLPMYRVASGQRYATREHLGAEKTLLAEAQLESGPVLEAERVGELAAELDAAGLGADQAHAVCGVLASGKAADILVGPAGTGKSFTVATLDELWRREFEAPVLGLATSQRATQVLQEEGLDALNVAEFLTRYQPRADGSQQQLPRGTALVVDEAGMADTDKLADIAKLVRQTEGKLLYTGDDAQLSAVGPGGIMRQLARDNTPLQLENVRRFHEHWERDASLKFRAGEADALAEYEQHGRLRGGTVEEMTEAAVRGYLADVLAGKESVLTVSDNAQASELSKRVRAELVALGRVGEDSLGDLRDDSPCGVGDRIQARLNQRDIDSSDGRMLVNRELLTVEGVDERGRMLARRDNGATVALPADYVEQHVTLAYASTVHAVQGRTTDTAHSLIERGQDRNAAYVQLSRGRDGNYGYCVSEVEADAHHPESYSGTAVDVLGEVLAHDGAQISAVETYRARLEAADSLAEISQIWGLVTRDTMADRHHDLLLDKLGPDRLDWMATEDSHEKLMRTLQHCELSGHKVDRLISDALARERPLDEAESMSATLAARIRRGIDEREPTSRPVPARWEQRTAATPGPIGEYARELGQLMDQRGETMARAAVLAPPEWALVALGPVPDEEDEAARRGWAERAAALGIYREIRGIDADEMGLGPAPAREQDPVAHVAWHRAWEALGRPDQQADHQLATDEQLREHVRRWEREQDWAPLYLAEELEQASTLAEEFRRQATHARAHLDTELDTAGETADADRLRTEAERAERMTERFDAAAERYQHLAEARDRWAEHTTEAAEAAEVAAAELDRRGHPLDAPAREDGDAEQLELLTVDEGEQVHVPDRLEPERAARELDDGHVLPPEPEDDSPEAASETPQPQQPDYYADLQPESESVGTPETVEQVHDGYKPPTPADERAHDEQAEQTKSDSEVEPEQSVQEPADEEPADEDADTADPEPDDQPEQQARGDYGSGYRLDEVAEADAHYPEPEPVDENQQALFDAEATAGDRVKAGQARSDSDLSVKAAQDRARLAEDTIAARELRAEHQAQQQVHQQAEAEAERQRAERERSDRQAQQQAQEEHARQEAARRVEQQAGLSEPELGL